MTITISRRTGLTLAAAAFGVAAIPSFGIAQQAAAPAEGGDVTTGPFPFPVEGGEVVFHPVSHASMVVETPMGVIYVDPVGGAEAYADLPAPALILITHEHGDHYDQATLDAFPEVPLVTNPAVHDMLPEAMRARTTAMANGDTGEVLGGISIEAIPAYNITTERLEYHPEGRDNGYVLTIGGSRFYIAGDTEDTPEMRALTDITVAFVPMNLPYTMTIEQAASGIAAFAPQTAFPYHHRDSDMQAFATLMAEQAPETQLVVANWYPEGQS